MSAIHVFEHIIDLNKFLIEMKTALKKDGILLLQVPNIDENIFDVFTIDHVSHFTRKSIYQILKRHFAFVSFTKNQIYREITVIASNKEIPLDNSEFFNTKDVNKKVFSDLLDGLRFKNKIAIFGASPSALFCATYLDFNIECFLDENKNKVGKKLFDKKIIHPLELEPNIEVLVPYSKKLYLQVSDRYPNLKFIYLKSEL